MRATITSKEFLNLRVFHTVTSVLNDPEFWMWLFVMCCVLYAPMRMLRLADQKATVMQFWEKCKPRLLHNYSLVGYMLSPNPTIMAHASDNKTLLHDGAAERLITKLQVDPSLVGHNWTIQRAKLIDTFMEEYGDFTNRRGVFARDNIWIMAADDNCKAYRWHFKYSYPQTKVGQTCLPRALQDFGDRNC